MGSRSIQTPPVAARSRASQRRIIPLTTGGISGELWEEGTPRHHGMIWDLSTAGACLVTTSAVDFLRGSHFELVLRPAIGIGEVRVPVAACWSQRQGPKTFVGVRFCAGLIAPGSFLDRLLRGSLVRGAAGQAPSSRGPGFKALTGGIGDPRQISQVGMVATAA